jgi:signal peptidase
MEETNPAPNGAKRQHRIWGIIKNIVFYAALALIAVFAVFSIVSRVNGDTLRFGSDEVRIVLTGSMDGEPTSYPIPTIKTGSAVIITDVPDDEKQADSFYAGLAVGDVLTFNYTQPSGAVVLVTHRIIQIQKDESSGVYVYFMKGDNDSGIQKASSDSGLIIGKVKSVSYGWGVFLTFLTGRWGLGLLVIFPACCICLYEIGKIVYLVREDKNKAALEQKAAADEKIKQLEQQLQELQKKDETKGGEDK